MPKVCSACAVPYWKPTTLSYSSASIRSRLVPACNMCACVYTYICICMHVCVCVYIYIYIYIYAHTYLHIHHVHVDVYIYTCIHCVCMYACIHAQQTIVEQTMFIYIHTHIHKPPLTPPSLYNSLSDLSPVSFFHSSKNLCARPKFVITVKSI